MKKKIIEWVHAGFLAAMFALYKLMWTEQIENVLLFYLWMNITFLFIGVLNVVFTSVHSGRGLESRKFSAHDWALMFIAFDIAASGRFVTAGFLIAALTLSIPKLKNSNKQSA